MVERRMFNIPVGRCNGQPVWWLQEKGTAWFCSSCKTQQPAGSLLFEIRVPTKYGSRPALSTLINGAIITGKGKSTASYAFEPDGANAIKRFLCLVCAERLFDEALAKIQTGKRLGKQGIEFFDNA